MSITLKEIATEAGLSWPTVAQILTRKGRFAESTRKRVLDLAELRGYRPSASARALRNQQTKLVGVVLRNAPDLPLTNMVALEYLAGINGRFQTSDYCTVLIRASELLADGGPEPRVFRERIVDGVIAIGVIPSQVVKRVTSMSPHTIWLDTNEWSDTCCLRRDEEEAGRIAAEAALSLGYKKICFVTRDALHINHYSHFDRLRGAKHVTESAGIDMSVISWPEFDGAREWEQLRNWIRPDVVLIASSLIVARQITEMAMSIGQNPGHHYGLICCDDASDLISASPGLCRVAFSRCSLGERAAEMMLLLLGNPTQPPVSIRASSRYIIGNTAWGPR